MSENSSKELVGKEPPSRGVLRPRARLLRTLGTDLISSDKVALIELVKNSYDADARTVLLSFFGPLEQGKGRIEIWDDGHGMDVETLWQSWLDIATHIKKRHPRSESGKRRVLGEKGIGRLAASRLGREMLLVTRRPNAEEIKLYIDWEDFDNEDLYLDQVEVAWEVGEADTFTDMAMKPLADSDVAVEHFQHGTLIQIDGLSRPWNENDFSDLRTALTRLIRPHPDAMAFSDGEVGIDFQIVLELKDVEEGLAKLSGPIDPPEDLKTSHYRLTGSVDEFGIAKLSYEQKYPFVKENIGVKQLWQDDKRKPEAGPFSFEINVWDRDDAMLKEILAEDSSGGQAPTAKDLKGFRETLSDVAGISVYRDSFRVLPFGESGDDWLALDSRRIQSPTRRISNNQVVGHIFIGSDTNEGLKDQSNREGILEGKPYDDLRILVRSVLNELEQRRYIARHPGKGVQKDRKGMFERFSLDTIRSLIKRNYPEDKELILLVKEKDQSIQKDIKKVQNVLSRYSRLATLGGLVDRVLHDGRTIVARLKNIARFGMRDLSKKQLTAIKKNECAFSALEDVSKQTELLSLLFNQIEPFGGRKRGRPRSIALSAIVTRAFSILQEEAANSRVDLLQDVPDVSVKLDEGEFLVVLVNLTQNAIYWTSTQPFGRERKVMVTANINDAGHLTVKICDSGPGIPESIRDYIFDPYFSTKPDGIGLGLAIAGNIVEDIYGGKLVLVDKGPLDGACFESTFRRRVS